MGTALSGTIRYTFPVLATLVDNTLTALTDITIYLPESSKVFRSVKATLTCDDVITATGGTVINRRMQMGLGGGTKTNISNTQTASHSGENISWNHSFDFTALFTASWSGTSMTVQCDILVDQSTGTTLGQKDCCVTVELVYEFDDTSTTRVKTAAIQLISPYAGLNSTKPSAVDTIPALDTELPEASKTYRQLSIEVLANVEPQSTTDRGMSFEIDSAGAISTTVYEGALQSDRMIRYCTSPSFLGSMTTNATHSWYIWSAGAWFNHPVCTLFVTYEYSESSTTTMWVDVMLPVNSEVVTIGTGSGAPTTMKAELWIQEASITTKRIAVAFFCRATAQWSGLNARIASGSYQAITDGPSSTTFCGGIAHSIVNNSAYTLARGRNTLSFEAYATSGGGSISGYWRVAYTCTKPSGGTHYANKTVQLNVQCMGTVAPSNPNTISAIKMARIPETALYFMSSWGVVVTAMNILDTEGTSDLFSVHGRLDSGNVKQRRIGVQPTAGDNEVGWSIHAFNPPKFVYMWSGQYEWDLSPQVAALITPSDPTANHTLTLDQWCRQSANPGFQFTVDLVYTYHTLSYTVSGDVSGSAGGTVTLYLCSATTGERLSSTTRVGNGSYSFTWWDNTENVFVDAYENNTHLGRSVPALAGT